MNFFPHGVEPEVETTCCGVEIVQQALQAEPRMSPKTIHSIASHTLTWMFPECYVVIQMTMFEYHRIIHSIASHTLTWTFPECYAVIMLLYIVQHGRHITC